MDDDAMAELEAAHAQYEVRLRHNLKAVFADSCAKEVAVGRVHNRPLDRPSQNAGPASHLKRKQTPCF